jgi:hypothetical protein
VSYSAPGGYSSNGMPFQRSLSDILRSISLLVLCVLAGAAVLFFIASNIGPAFAEASQLHPQDLVTNGAAVDQSAAASQRIFSRSIGDSVALAITSESPNARVPRVFNVGISDGLSVTTAPTPPSPSNAATTTNASTSARPSSGLQSTGRIEEKLGQRSPAESKSDLTTSNKDQKNTSTRERSQGSIIHELESILSTLLRDLLGADDSEPDDNNNLISLKSPPVKLSAEQQSIQNATLINTSTSAILLGSTLLAAVTRQYVIRGDRLERKSRALFLPQRFARNKDAISKSDEIVPLACVLLLVLVVFGFLSISTAMPTSFSQAFADGSLKSTIELSAAYHLDLERKPLRNIYDQTRKLDEVWSEEVSDGQYIRVSFEQNLTSGNDITIYPRIISGTPTIQVYEIGRSVPIAEFTSIRSNQYNKVLLENTARSQNTFDLRVLGGSVEFDHIVDPWPIPTYVGAGTASSSTNTITPALPSGIQTGDILLLFVETANQAATISNSAGGTWTQITNSPQGTGTAGSTSATRLSVFWSRYNGVQTAPTVADSGDHQLGVILAFRGVVTTGNPLDISSGGVESNADTSGSITGATTTAANTLVVMAAATSLPDANGSTNFSAWANSNLANIAEIFDTTINTGNGGGLGIATGEKADAGVYGATSFTVGTAAAKGMMTIALKRQLLSFSSAISDSQPITDSISIKVTRPIFQTVMISPSILGVRSKLVSIPQTITVTPVVLAVTPAVNNKYSLSRSISDTVAVSSVTAKVHHASRSMSDSLSLSAVSSSATARPLSVALSLIDTISIRSTRNLSESVTIATEEILQDLQPSVYNNLSISDSISIETSRTLFDSLSVTLSVIPTTNRLLSDSISLTDAPFRKVSRPLFDTILTADFVAPRTTRVLSDTMGLTDVVSKSVSSSTSDPVAITDAISARTSRTLGDAISLTETVSRVTLSARGISEDIAISSALIPRLSSLFTEPLTLTDSISSRTLRSISDSIAAEDAISKSTRGTVADSLSLSDAALVRVSRSIFDSMTIGTNVLQEGRRPTDTIIALDDTISTTVTRSLVDTVSIEDATAKETAGLKSVFDNIGIADSLTSLTSHLLVDSIPISDTISSNTQRPAAETLSVIDSVSMSTSRSLSDALVVSANDISKTSALRIADTVAVTYALSSSSSHIVAVSDSVEASDLMTRALEVFRLADDAVSVVDTTNSPLSLERSISDTLPIADTVQVEGSIRIPISESLAISETITRAGSGPFSDSVVVTDAVSMSISRSVGDSILITDSIVPPISSTIMIDIVKVSDQVYALVGSAVSLADSLDINSEITNVTVHWNRAFEEGMDLADCTPFSCNQSLHFDEGLNLVDSDFFTSPPGRVLTENIEVTEGITSNRPTTFLSLADSTSVSVALKPLLPILVNDHANDHGRPPIQSVAGTYAWDGTPAKLRDALELEPLYFNNTVIRDNLPNQIITLRLRDVSIVPTANLPANNTLLSDRAANLPAGVPVQTRVNFVDSPALSEHSNFIKSLDVKFTPAVLTTDFGLIVTPMTSPPVGATMPPEELRPLYIDVKWWGNVPSASTPSVESYYEHPPTFTFTVSDDWATSQSAARDANGVPIIKIRLLNETTYDWRDIDALEKPSAADNGVYTFTATLPHFSDYAITVVKSDSTIGSSSSSSHMPSTQPRTFTVSIEDSLAIETLSNSKAVSIVEEFANEKFSANLFDSVRISSKPVVYNTFQILKDVKVSITVLDVKQDGVMPPSAKATLQVDMTNAGDVSEKFTLNFWYNDHTGKRQFDLSQQVEVEANQSKTVQVVIPFTEPGTYSLTAEARGVSDNELLESTQLSVAVSWLSVYLYILIAVAIVILGGSAIAIALYMARHGIITAAEIAAAGAIVVLLLGKRKNPLNVKVVERGSVANNKNNDYDRDNDKDFDLIINISLINGSEGNLVNRGDDAALFDFEMLNLSRRKQEFVLAYQLTDMAGATIAPESAINVKIAGRKTEVHKAHFELLSGSYLLLVEARTMEGKILDKLNVSVRVA